MLLGIFKVYPHNRCIEKSSKWFFFILWIFRPLYPLISKRVTNSQFRMFQFCHVLRFWHPYKLINLKIFDRKFDRGLVGYRPWPKPPLYLKLRKEMSRIHKNGERQKQFHLQSDRHCILECPLRCDPLRFFKKVIAIDFIAKVLWSDLYVSPSSVGLLG